MSLQSAGYVVKFCTSVQFVDFAKSLGVDAIGVAIDTDVVLRTDPDVLEAQRKGDFPSFAKCLGAIATYSFKDQAKLELEVVRDFKPELMIIGPIDVCFRIMLGHLFDIPIMGSSLQVLTMSGYTTSLLNEPEWLPGRVHVMAHWIVEYLFLKSEEVKINILRDEIKLEGSDKYMTCFLEMEYDFRYPLIKPMCPAPSFHKIDMPDVEDIQVPTFTGPWVIDATEQGKQARKGNTYFGGDQTNELERFLAGGPPPVCIGWGSMVSEAPENMTKLAVGALKKLKVRGIVIGGVAQLWPELLAGEPELAAYAEKHVLFLHWAPHETLFPRCSVLVHHGGIGTTTASLRAGRPQVILPVFADQVSNARKAVNAGVGVYHGHYNTSTVDSLSKDVQACLDDTQMAKACEELGARVRAESGTKMAVEIVGQVFKEEIDSGKWREVHERRKALLQGEKAKQTPSFFTWMMFVCCMARPNNIRHWVEDE